MQQRVFPSAEMVSHLCHKLLLFNSPNMDAPHFISLPNGCLMTVLCHPLCRLIPFVWAALCLPCFTSNQGPPLASTPYLEGKWGCPQGFFLAAGVSGCTVFSAELGDDSLVLQHV
jgi:hypothetical protein